MVVDTSGAEPVPGAAAELVRRREFPALAGRLGAQQASGGGRPYQPSGQLRPAARLRLLGGLSEAAQTITVQRRRQRRRHELRHQTTSPDVSPWST